MEIDSVTSAGMRREPARLDALAWVAGAMALIGVGSVGWMLVDSMNPAVDATLPLWIDLDRISAGDRETIQWRGIPIFVVHRTSEEIASARAEDSADMPFPERDMDRVQRDDRLIVIGLDTFHGWDFLTGQGAGEEQGDRGGWHERQQDSHYDVSGRLQHGIGNGNLIVPDYRFVSDSRIEMTWPIEALSELTWVPIFTTWHLVEQ